jgi:Legume lectin domain
MRRLSLVWLPISISLALAAPAGAASYDYPDFASTAGLQLNGDAKQEGNLLRLTPALPSEAGSAFGTTPIDPLQSWQTQFQISMHDHTCCDVRPADGIGFVLQGAGLGGGSGLGGSLGYGGVKPSVVVEFDIFEENSGDPPSDHVAIMSEGDTVKHLACANEGVPSGGCGTALPFGIFGAPVHAWVDYDVGTQHLKVFLAQTAAKPAAPLLDHQISLAPLGAAPYAGFTAATGAHNAVQDVLSWRFGQGAPPAATPIGPEAKKPAKKPCRPFKGKGKKGKAKGKGAKASAAKGKKKGKGKGKKCGHKKKGQKKPGKGKGRG